MMDPQLADIIFDPVNFNCMIWDGNKWLTFDPTFISVDEMTRLVHEKFNEESRLKEEAYKRAMSVL